MTSPNESQLSRRSLLRYSAAAVAAGALHPYAADAAGPTENQITFGFSLYGMRSLPLEQAFEVCAGIGYDAVELVCNEGWASAPESLGPDDRRKIREVLRHHGLALPALMENLPLLVDEKSRRKHRDRLKAAAQLGHDLSPQKPPVIETVLGGKKDDWEANKNAMADELKTWAEIGNSSKTVIAIKPHVGGALHTPEGADWLVRQVDSPWIRLAYDYSHYQAQGLPMLPSLKLLLPNSVFIHVKDNVGTGGKVQFALPGDGDTDYLTYFKQVAASGYHGTIMIEVSSQLHRKPDYDPIAAAKHSFANLTPALKQSGLWKPAT